MKYLVERMFSDNTYESYTVEIRNYVQRKLLLLISIHEFDKDVSASLNEWMNEWMNEWIYI